MSTREISRSPLGLQDTEAYLTIPQAKLVYGSLLLLTFALALVLRFRGLPGDFPLFDGGMFYAMIGDVSDNGYRLPEAVSYNGGDIPFSYPPLAFYIGAALEDVLGVSRLTVMQALPALASFATVAGFFVLAGGLLKSRWAVLSATFAFAVMPETFSWMIVGGGLTRSLGFMFAVFALSQIHRMYTRPDKVYGWTSILLVSLTVFTHLEMTLFLALSAAAMFAFFGRDTRGVYRSLMVVAGGLIATLPWWATVISREGLSPWLDTGSSRGVLDSSVLSVFLNLNLSGQYHLNALGFLAIFGLFACLVRREFFLPVWVAAIALLLPWVFTRLASVPAAILVGYTVGAYVLPWLQQGLPGVTKGSTPLAWLAPALLAVFIVPSVATGLEANRHVLRSVPDESRIAMRWVEANTRVTDRFLVVTGRAWFHDYVAEWFPAVAERRSVSTVQGTEWLGYFDQRVQQHRQLTACVYDDESCLSQWLLGGGEPFTHVYLSKDLPPEFTDRGMRDCCAALRGSLRSSSDYRVIYDGPGATIFRVAGATTPSVDAGGPPLR